jgi:hypothetical protein
MGLPIELQNLIILAFGVDQPPFHDARRAVRAHDRQPAR